MYLDIRLYITSLDNLIWSALRSSHQESGIIRKNVQKKSGIMGHLIMNVGIMNNIINGAIAIDKKKRSSNIGIMEELITENVI